MYVCMYRKSPFFIGKPSINGPYIYNGMGTLMNRKMTATKTRYSDHGPGEALTRSYFDGPWS